MIRSSCASRRTLTVLLALGLLLLAAPSTGASEIDRCTRLLQNTADHFEFGMQVERSTDEAGGFDLSVWKRMGDGGVSFNCLAHGSAKHKKAFFKLAEIMQKAAKEVQSGGVPSVKKTQHTIEGYRVLEGDTPSWTYKTPTMNTTMPRIRTMTVDVTPLVTLTVTTNGGAGSPKQYMRKLLQDYRASGATQPPPKKEEKKTDETEPPPAEEEIDVFEDRIAASAEGYAGAVERIVQEQYSAGRVTLTGVVRDTEGAPVAGAKVVTMERDLSTTTDKDGRYKLVMHGTGEKPWTKTLDLVMARKLTDFACRLESQGPLVANGKLQRVTLHLSNEGKPLAEREVKVSLPPEWRHRTRQATWVAHGRIRSLRDTLTTNKQGAVTFDFPAAGLLPGRPTVLRSREHLNYFPVRGELVVTDVLTKLTCRTDYHLVSPYPRIKTMRMIDVTAGNWQPKPGSLLEIDDPDSVSFDVEVRVMGRMRIPRVKERYLRKMYLPKYEGNRLVFFYQPPAWGMDLTKQPQNLWKEFALFNLQLAGKIVLDKAGNAFLKQVSVAGAIKSIPNKLIGNADLSEAALKHLAKGQAAAAEDVLNGAKKLWSVVETTDKIEQQLDDKTSSTEDKVINAWDTMGGIVELSSKATDKQFASKWGSKLLGSGKLGKMSDAISKSGVPLDALKVVYENAKFMLKLHRQFEAVCNAQKDTLLMPVFVTVTDPDGYTTTAARNVTMWLWKKGD